MMHIPNSASPSPQLAWTAAAQEMVGNSLVMKILRRAIQKVAATHSGVLITGETGTGKELVARLLHRHSARAAGPFVAVNCAALPANLFNAEVFGYEKGAFTGADRRNPGRVETAHGGTLFLDEVGDLAPEVQVVGNDEEKGLRWNPASTALETTNETYPAPGAAGTADSERVRGGVYRTTDWR